MTTEQALQKQNSLLRTMVAIGIVLALAGSVWGIIHESNEKSCTNPKNAAEAATMRQAGCLAGPSGESAYQVWLSAGHHGSMSVYLSSLEGSTGATGPQGAQGQQGEQGPRGIRLVAWSQLRRRSWDWCNSSRCFHG